MVLTTSHRGTLYRKNNGIKYAQMISMVLFGGGPMSIFSFTFLHIPNFFSLSILL